MKNYLLLGALVLSCLTPSCGDAATDDGGGADSCGKVAACGGDITGDWAVMDSCLSFPVGLGMFCSEATVDTSGVSASGSFSYKADGTYTSNGTISGTVTVGLPPKCLSQNGGPAVTCEQLTMQTKGMDTELNCTKAAEDGCACNVVMQAISMAETGTYKTNGNTLSTTQEGETEDSGYCVSGDNLHLLPTSDTSSSGVNVTGDIVFSRK